MIPFASTLVSSSVKVLCIMACLLVISSLILADMSGAIMLSHIIL